MVQFDFFRLSQFTNEKSEVYFDGFQVGRVLTQFAVSSVFGNDHIGLITNQLLVTFSRENGPCVWN